MPDIPADLDRARETMIDYHMASTMPLTADLRGMKPIEMTRALLDAFEAWEPFIATALAAERERTLEACIQLCHDRAAIVEDVPTVGGHMSSAAFACARDIRAQGDEGDDHG